MTDIRSSRWPKRTSYGNLFTLDLYWGAPDHPPIDIELEDGGTVTATNVSSYKGVRVWGVPTFPAPSSRRRSTRPSRRPPPTASSSSTTTTSRSGVGRPRTTRASASSRGPARHVHRAGTRPEIRRRGSTPSAFPTTSSSTSTSPRQGSRRVRRRDEERDQACVEAHGADVRRRREGLPADFDPKQRDHEISVTLARVLFLLFGDDTEMWAHRRRSATCSRLHQGHTERDGTDIGHAPQRRCSTTSTPTQRRATHAPELAAFPYVNGGIFDEQITLPDLGQGLPRRHPRRPPRSTGRPSAPRSSARCSSQCVTPRPAASSASTTPPRRTSSRR